MQIRARGGSAYAEQLSGGRVYSKIHLSLALGLAISFSNPMMWAQNPPAQTPAPISAAASTSATIRGKITDPSGALIPGTDVTVSDRNGRTVATGKADAGGSYEIRSIPPGSYTVTATTQGFAPFVSQQLVLAAGQIKRIDVAMAIETAQQNVVVTDESPTVSVDVDNNASSLVIKGKDLEALSDDPDELQNELSALAGPSAGPNGGQIFIDGFSGGQLPPKSSIREIRVNQNPYSAEFDRLGFGRIEILTKPGTDKLHGQFMIQGNDSNFNTGTPFSRNIPPYYSYQYNGTLNGSLDKNTSFFVSAEHRTTNNEIVFSIPCDYFGNCNNPNIPALANPHLRTNVSARLDRQFGSRNTLTVRYGYFRDTESGDLSSTQYPTQSGSATNNNNSIQISDTEIINDHVVNETRFQYERSTSSSTPVSTAPSIAVSGIFSIGGSSQQFTKDHTDRLEFQNLTTMSLGRHALKFGTRLRDGRDANSADSGFNGSFTFSSQGAYSDAVKKALDPTYKSTATPTQLTYSSGKQSAMGNVFDAALYIQDDWKFSPRLTLSGGLRWESQNHVSDHSDFAPRFSLAWAVDGGKDKQAKTVLRAGYGIFYDRLGVNNFLTINRSEIQNQVTEANPSEACFLDNFKVFTGKSCGTGTTVQKTISQVAHNYHSPYTQQFGASIERQLTKTQTVTVTYLHSTGVHQLVTINANAPYSPAYDAKKGVINQYLPEGIFQQDQMIVNSNVRFNARFNVFGFYTLSFANTNGAGGSTASNSIRLSDDFGRAGFVSRNSLFMIGNYTAPWGIRLNPFLIAQSGKAYNITAPTDLNGDQNYNDRPYIADSANCSGNTIGQINSAGFVSEAGYGCLDVNPDSVYKLTGRPSSEKLLAHNAGNGPAAVAVNLRISRAFGFGPKLVSADPNQGAGGPPGGGPPGGGRGPGGGGPGGGFGPGGFGGGGGRGGPGGMFGPTSTGRKFNLNMSVQALNLFNNIDYGTPIGTVGSSRFGKSTALAGQIFSQGSAARRVFLQAIFSF